MYLVDSANYFCLPTLCERNTHFYLLHLAYVCIIKNIILRFSTLPERKEKNASNLRNESWKIMLEIIAAVNKAVNDFIWGYREAGMSEEAIQAMYEFDLGVLNSERAYDANTVAVCDGEDDVDARKAANLKQYEAAITVTDTYHETKSRFGWIGEIEDERLLSALENLSDSDLELITLYAYEGYDTVEISKAFGTTKQNISKKINRISKFIKNFQIKVV